MHTAEPAARAEPSSGRFLLRMLGHAELCEIAPGGNVMPRLLGPGKPLALLAYCTCARDREHSRDLLAGLLWTDTPPEKARHNVRQAIWRIRRLVGDALQTRDDAVAGIAVQVESDRDRFQAAVHGNDAELALSLYDGPLLPGLNLPGGDDFEEWLAIERRLLQEALLRVVEPHVRELLQRGRPGRATEIADRLIAVAPDSLDAHRLATDVLTDVGDRAAARRLADATEKLALESLGQLPPAIAMAINRARVAQPPDAADTIKPIALDLVGREGEFGVVLQAWTRARKNETQVVLLTGSAGIGKSRLLSAITSRCAGRRARAVTVRANPGELDVPFGFAASIARALANQPGAAGINADSARELVALDPSLGSTFATSPAATDGGETVRRRSLALLDLLSAIAEQEPLALLLDDLHWADPASRQLLAIVLGRATDLAMLVVVTTRGAGGNVVEHRALTSVPLLPLDDTGRIDAIRSSGTWPEHAEAQRFVRTLADVSDGIPLAVIERLAYARDRGHLVDLDGVWSSPDWPAAIRDIATASPLDQRLLACSRVEMGALLTLSVAGTSLSDDVLRDAFPASDAHAVADSLRTLEVKGLVLRTRDGWAIWHDVVSERALALSTPDEHRVRHQALATALMLAGSSLFHAAALRHFLRSADDDSAGQVFARIVATARRSGDTRHARDLLTDCVGERVPEDRLRRVLRAVPLWNRSARLRMRSALVAVTIVALATSTAAWYARRQPALSFAQAPVLTQPTPLLGNDAFRLVPSPLVRMGTADQARGGAQVTVQVRSLRPTASVLSGDAVLSDSGVASFGALRIRTADSTVSLRFEAAGFRPLDFEMKTFDSALPNGPGISTARLLDGTLNGQRTRGPNGRITVTRNTMISGVVQMEYNADWPAASVWVSMTPNWGRAKDVGRDLSPVPTPVRRDVFDGPIDVLAPSVPGHYWILVVMDAEPSGGYSLSRTNWTMGEAIWDDGNDVASLADSTIRRANADGRVRVDLAYPSTFPRTDLSCRAGTFTLHGVSVRYCPAFVGMFGIEVIVN